MCIRDRRLSGVEERGDRSARGCGNEGPQHLFLTAADGRQTEGDVLTAGGLMDDDAAEEAGDGRDTEGAQVKRAPPAHGDGILGVGDEGVEGVEVVILAPQRHDDDTAEQDGGGRSYGALGPCQMRCCAPFIGVSARPATAPRPHRRRQRPRGCAERVGTAARLLRCSCGDRRFDAGVDVTDVERGRSDVSRGTWRRGATIARIVHRNDSI